jgi:CubicO group peptidase (beta-lactamase class C family)
MRPVSRAADLSADLVERVDGLVDAFASDGAQPGLAFGVVRDGELVLSGGRGVRALPGRGIRPGSAVPDADTVFRIASMTKSFTAAAILMLRDEGAVALDDEAVRYVPALAGVRPPTQDAAPLTIRTLLTMTGGLPTDDPWGDRQQGLPDADFDTLLAGGLSFAWSPGTAFEYSNLGYAILGRVVAAASGEPYREVITRRLVEPLGMTSTVFEASQVPPQRLAIGHVRRAGGWEPVPFDPYGAFAPMGGILSSVRDLARWVGEYTDAFPPRDDPDGGHPLRRSSRREQQQPTRPYLLQLGWTAVDVPPVLRAAHYGLGLAVETHPRFGAVVGHSGGYPGFGSHMRWHPASGLGVVVLGNATYAPAFLLTERILDALLAADLDHAPRVAVHATAPREAGPWPETEAAAADVERLVADWDDELAGRLFAENVDLDEPIAARRTRLEQLRDLLGPLDPDPSASVERTSPAHRAWWMRGPGGRLRLDIRMTPQRPPLVQSLTFVAVPEPSADLRRAVTVLRWSLNSTLAAVPPLLAFTEDVDRGALQRLLQSGAAWAGAVTIGDVVGGDGINETVLRLHGTRRDLLVGVRLATSEPPGPGGAPRVSGVSLRPVPD